MRLALLLLALAGCSTDFVSPEDDRCTLVTTSDVPVFITRWQIDNCESVRVLVMVES